MKDIIAKKYNILVLRDGVVVRASALQSVDLGFISLAELYQKTFKNAIHRPSLLGARHLRDVVGLRTCCALGQRTYRDAPTLKER